MASFIERIISLSTPSKGAKPKAKKIETWGTIEPTTINYTGMNVYWAEYRRDSLVRQCLNLLAYFTVHTGFRVSVRGGTAQHNAKLSKYLEQLLAKINLEDAIYTGLIGKKIWGRFGFEIVRDGNNEIVQLLPLFPPDKLVPKLSENLVLQGFEFTPTGAHTPIQYKPEEVLYFTETNLEADMKGLSAIEPILTACQIKRELFKDLKEASKRLWSPIGVFTLNTSACKDAKEVEDALREFANSIEPGKPIVTNQSVSGSFFNAMPDVERIVRAIEKIDEEIMGNFGIPKALLARERTMNRATLEYSLTALYQSQIEGLQRYMAREIQLQLLDLVKTEVLGEVYARPITCEIVWNPRTSLELDRQFRPVFTLYALGIIDIEYLYDLLCLDKNRMPKQLDTRFDYDTIRAVLGEMDAETIKTRIQEVIDSSEKEGE